MKHLLTNMFLLASLTTPALAAVQDDGSVYTEQPQSSIIPGGGGFGPGMIVGFVSADEKAFDDLVETVSTNPAFAGTEVRIVVNGIAKVVDRKTEKAPPNSNIVSDGFKELAKVFSRNASAKGSIRLEYLRFSENNTQLDGHGDPIPTDKLILDIDAGASWGTAAAAQAEASMKETMNKNHK